MTYRLLYRTIPEGVWHKSSRTFSSPEEAAAWSIEWWTDGQPPVVLAVYRARLIAGREAALQPAVPGRRWIEAKLEKV